MSINRRLDTLSDGLERAVHALRARLRERAGGRSVELLVLRGHGGPGGVVVSGKVLEDRGLTPPGEHDSPLQNLLSAYRRFETEEVPGVRVQLGIEDRLVEAVTDEAGSFRFRLPEANLRPGRDGWRALAIGLPAGEEEGGARVATRALLRVPHAGVDYGVISDVDDTVLRTGAESLLSVARLTFLHNARTRRAFRGVGALYRALEAGVSGGLNPFFYVSSSPWNLHDLLADFLELQRIPAGPMFLREMGAEDAALVTAGHAEHKLEMIGEILEVHPRLTFVLVGDSGQKDPEVYHEAMTRWPSRFRVAYIRQVSSPEREVEVKEIAHRARGLGVEMVLARDSLEVARHAAGCGLIRPEAVAEVEATFP